MEVGKSVAKAIDDMEAGDSESAMLHACNAIDGTAKKAFPTDLSSNLRFTKLLRQNYSVLSITGMPGIDLAKTRFPVAVQNPKAPDGQPDLADVIYGIHRCSHGHGNALPTGFALLPDSLCPDRITTVVIEQGKIQLSDRIVFGMLTAAVLASQNVGQSTPPGYYLTLGGVHTFIINDWWGRRADFEAVASTYQMPSVKLDFGDWMP